MEMAPGSKPCWGKELSETSRRATAESCQPYRSAAGGGEGEVSLHPPAGAVASTGTERKAGMGSVTSPPPERSRPGGSANFCKLLLSKSCAGSASAALGRG